MIHTHLPFGLSARVFGGGAAFSAACVGMSIVAEAGNAAAWSGAANATRPAVVSSDASGRACQLEWRCEQCQLSGSVSSTVLSLRSVLPSWATFVNFTFEAPPFGIAGATRTEAPALATAASGVGGAGIPFSTFGSISPMPAALRGEAATQVALSLIGVSVQTAANQVHTRRHRGASQSWATSQGNHLHRILEVHPAQ